MSIWSELEKILKPLAIEKLIKQFSKIPELKKGKIHNAKKLVERAFETGCL